MSTMTSTVPDHEIITVTSTQQVLKQQCYDVRIAVFVHEQGFSLDDEIDHLDDSAIHLLLRLIPSLKPVGTIRLTKAQDYYKLSRLAVLEDYRQHRFGRALVLALHDFVRNDAKGNGVMEHIRIISHSQIPVKGFYSKYGYIPEGEEFDEDGAPHQKMVAVISLSD